MTRENAILCLKGIKNYGRDTFTEQSDWQDSLDMAIKALEQEPTTKNDLGVDSISRQAVLDLIADYDLSMGQVVKGIHALPSVTPQEPRWIPVSERMPEEREWIGTKKFGTTISDEVYVTLETISGKRFCDHIRFQNGKFSLSKQAELDAISKGTKPIAWMKLPEPYQPKDGEKE